MAVVPVPRTLAPGIITSTFANAYWRDPIDFLQNKPFAKVTRAAVQSIPNNTFTAVSFDTEIFDSHTFWDSGSPTQAVALYPGWYEAVGHFGLAPSATGLRGVGFQVSGTTSAAGFFFVPGFASLDTRITAVEDIYLNVGDYIEVIVFQNSGGALNTATSTGSLPALSLTWKRI